jgi:hypothetical protein
MDDLESRRVPMDHQTASMIRPPPPSSAPPPVPPVAFVGDYIEKENGHSMPSLEQVRTEGAIHGTYNRYSGKQKRTALVIGLTVLLVALVTGVTVSQVRHKSTKSSSSAAENADNPAGAPDDNGDDNARDDDEAGLDLPRLQLVQDFLSEKITPLATLKDITTPQYMAAKWIADQDDYGIDIPDDPTNVDDSYDFVQRYVMAVFYYALGGDEWQDDYGFLSPTPVCDWNEPLSPDTTPDGNDPQFWNLGVTCDENDEILQIYIGTCKARIGMRILKPCPTSNVSPMFGYVDYL